MSLVGKIPLLEKIARCFSQIRGGVHARRSSLIFEVCEVCEVCEVDFPSLKNFCTVFFTDSERGPCPPFIPNF